MGLDPGATGRASSFLRNHTEATALVGLLVAVVGFSWLKPGAGVPAPLYLLGVVGGATLALHAIGIVLVHRASRVINFAQVTAGALASLLFVGLVEHRSFIRGVATICPPCLPRPQTFGDLLDLGGGPQLRRLLEDPAFRSSFDPGTKLTDKGFLSYLPADFSLKDFSVDVAPGWLVHLNYWLAMTLSVALAAFVLWLVYVLIIRRIAHAPKLVLTVVTIASGFFVQALGGRIIGSLFAPAQTAGATGGGTSVGLTSEDARLPVDLTFSWGSVVFSAVDIVTIVVVGLAVLALVLFFRRSRLGIVLRGAAENPDRAETLGVNVSSVTARAWLLAGALSGVAGVLFVARSGASLSGGGYETLVRALAAAVAGGLLQLPLTVAGAVVIGVSDWVLVRAVGSQAVLSALLLPVVIILLLAQRARATRAEREAFDSWEASRELRPTPHELRDLPPVRNTVRVFMVIGVLLVLGYPWFMSSSQTNVAIVTMTQAIVGLSLLILTGWAGQISLGQMAFAAIGAWVAAVSGFPFVLAVLGGAVAGTIVAVLVGIPSLKLRGLHLAISTLALGLATAVIFLQPSLLGRHLPSRIDRPMLLGINFESERAFYYMTLLLVAAAILATMGMRRSRVARALIASKDNELAAQSFGINLMQARLTAFAISGFMAAFAGAIFAYSQQSVDQRAFALDTSVSVFLMTLIGGLGSVAGPVIGALYLGGLRVLSATGLRQLADTLLNPGLGLLFLLLYLPGGLVQGVYLVRDAWLRRIASRYRIAVPSLMGARDEASGRLPIVPNLRPTGGQAFIPKRYRVDGQWIIRARRDQPPDREAEKTRG